MPSIEMAMQDDLPNIIDLNLLALEELKDSLCHPVIRGEVEHHVIKNWLTAPCFILRTDKIIGFAGMQLTRAYSNPSPILKDYMFYVLPEYRSIENLKALCDAAIQFAKDHNMPLVLNYITTKDVKSHMRLMKRMGFSVTGIIGVSHG